MVKARPAVARMIYTTVRPRETVTTSSIGIPSIGTPSVYLHIIHFYFHIHVGKYLTRKHERGLMGFKCTVVINKNYTNLSSNLC